MIRAAYAPYKLRFISPAVTSRSVMLHKDAFFLKVWDDECPDCFGVGECALFRGLGADDRPGYEERVALLCREVNAGVPVSDLSAWGSVLFGWETAVSDFANGGRRIPFPSAFSAGEEEIPINGLVWMGTGQEMAGRIRDKLDAGFRCVKLKIGGIGFDSELELLRDIRKRFSAESLELRLDANGAFSPAEALTRIDALSRFGIHSIEQPIRRGQYAEMARICRESPVDIALDEELIGLTSTADKERMLDAIRPRYVILKPSLCGGFASADEWIRLARDRGIGWWATSALESNIGLNAIAQWVSSYHPDIPQGLGTGMLYSNNVESPLRQERDVLLSDTSGRWCMPQLEWIEP